MSTHIRPPVIAVLGHVDHGKTTLLDYIRKTNVAGGEFGGITQHIGAYEITTKEHKKITFIDTPGHEAFSSLRKRGVQIADIALLVVAADSSVKPQTIEALQVIREAGIPFIVVVNKIDLPDIIVEKVFKDLNKNNVHLEGRGGEVPYVELSAKTGKGVDSLLELIILISELKNQTFDPQGALLGGVVEVKKDKRGVVATVILKNGTVKIGNDIYIGEKKVRAKALVDSAGVLIDELSPSTPAELLGCKYMPLPGDIVSDKAVLRQQEAQKTKTDELRNVFFAPNKKQFNFIIKADASGTEEVLREKLAAFDEIKIIKSEIGEVNESDIELAKGVKASVLAFNVKLRGEIAKKAEAENVSIFSYTLIYDLLDQIEELIYSLREREEKEARKVGEAKILAEFVKGPVKIAGMRMLTGKIKPGLIAEVIRGKKSLGETTIKSLYKRSNPVGEASKGDECGAIFSSSLDFKQGDIVKLYIP